VRLGAQESEEFRIVEPHRAVPEIAKFQHLAEYGDDRTGSESQNPRESADGSVRLADDPLNGMGISMPGSNQWPPKWNTSKSASSASRLSSWAMVAATSGRTAQA